jgi:hypothetical protein
MLWAVVADAPPLFVVDAEPNPSSVDERDIVAATPDASCVDRSTDHIEWWVVFGDQIVFELARIQAVALEVSDLIAGNALSVGVLPRANICRSPDVLHRILFESSINTGASRQRNLSTSRGAEHGEMFEFGLKWWTTNGYYSR